MAYRYGALHCKLTWENFDYLVIMYWKKLSFWIEHARKPYPNARHLFRKFELMDHEEARDADANACGSLIL